MVFGIKLFFRLHHHIPTYDLQNSVNILPMSCLFQTKDSELLMSVQSSMEVMESAHGH